MQRKGFIGLLKAGLLGANLAAATAMGAPAVHVEPGPSVLAGGPLHVHVTGARPGTRVTLSAERWFAGMSTQRPQPRLMRSTAVFVADADGR